MKIYPKTLITLLSVSLIPLTVISFVIYSLAKREITKEELVHLEAIANIQKKRVEETIGRNKERLDLITSRVPMRVAMLEFMKSGDRRQQEIVTSALSGAKGAVKDFRRIYILSSDGRVVASTDRAMHGSDHSGMEYFIKGKDGYSLNIFSSDHKGEVTSYLSAPIYHEEKTLGVMVAEVSPEWISSVTKDYTGLGDTGESLLAKRDKDGDAIYIVPLRFDPQAALKRTISMRDTHVAISQALSKNERASADNIDYRGKEVLSVTGYIREMDWGFVVKVDKEEAYAPLVKLRYLTITFAIITLFLVSALALYITRLFTGPISALTGTAKRISEGDMPIRAAVTSKDEVGNLELYFNKMTEGLIKANLSLNEAQRMAHIGSWELDLVNNRLTWSDEIYHIFEIDRERFGASYDAFLAAIHPEDREAVDLAYTNSLKTRSPYAIEHRLLFPNGRVKYVHEQCETFYDPDGKPFRSVGTVQDITERKKAEEAMRESEKRYKRLVGSVMDYFYTLKVENGFPVHTSHGPGCVAVTGYASEEYEADPNLWQRIVYEEDRQRVMEESANAISGKVVQPFEHRIIHRDGSLRWVRNTPVSRYDGEGGLISCDGLISDVTERRKIEEQLRHSQKMEAIGTLTGGIAHDFNNILTAMMSYCSLLQMKMKKDETQAHYVDQILSLVERATNMTQSLLAFSRKQISVMKPAGLNGIVKRVEKLLKRLISEDIEMKAILADMELPVMADGGQIEQVLINLCTNARDAMPKGGKLTIETGMVELGREYTASHGYGEPGEYAIISVRDTGTGMDEEVKAKIFEPFFTTKEMGKGTGLGLSMTYGIIKQHHGYINVESRPREGTEFKVYLPLIKEHMEITNPQSGTTTSQLPEGGTDTILLAEDEPYLREATREILEEYGYKVIAAVDGKDAIDKFMENRDAIRLLLLDAVMPVKDGKEAYKEIKKARPDIRAIFLSGHTLDVIHKKEILAEGVSLIIKPVSPKDLLAKIKEVFV